MTDKISRRDLGTAIQVFFKEDGAVVDISAATSLEIELTKPDGDVLTKTAVLITTGTDGGAQYILVSGDIDFNEDKGNWSYIGIVTFSATQKFHSVTPKTFEVV